MKLPRKATAALHGGKVSLLKGGKVVVTASTPTAVDGTFSWAGGGMPGAPITEGKFHATFRKKKP